MVAADLLEDFGVRQLLLDPLLLAGADSTHSRKY
jgi:hypothetical protein